MWVILGSNFEITEFQHSVLLGFQGLVDTVAEDTFLNLRLVLFFIDMIIIFVFYYYFTQVVVTNNILSYLLLYCFIQLFVCIFLLWNLQYFLTDVINSLWILHNLFFFYFQVFIQFLQISHNLFFFYFEICISIRSFVMSSSQDQNRLIFQNLEMFGTFNGKKEVKFCFCFFMMDFILLKNLFNQWQAVQIFWAKKNIYKSLDRQCIMNFVQISCFRSYYLETKYKNQLV
eukprot:TRINITY_DN16979_c0_g3_i2.p1 TRINITY_DN16979_c0_g3~~TRINITY_DN16979_c0_g3_i2.p1  ORF type:complete len:230 (-),score=-13.42 TRINITY_DN16979_c0_g3_i2:916-1605(-)